MRVATYNIHRGRGTAGLFRPDRILRVLSEIRPDLIALQEAQHYFRREKGMLDAEVLEREIGLRPLRVTAQQGFRSNLLLVRRDARLLHGPVGLRLGGWEPRGALLAELDLGGGPFRVVTAHLSLSARRRTRQAELMLEAIRAVGGFGMPTLVLGDFNEWRPHHSVLEVLAHDFGAAAGVPTFPAFRPVLALDQIFGAPRGIVTGLRAHDSPMARRASDHLPLVAEVVLPGAG
ncbi:endonuclease/exonuclease/phosphatase family protein [Muricoccus radiodurans]|uniref:endonuclease/exonuclease/phosphatase family protein n=1 Tax=Muricoccus radiodurans TaxID=2231721 RepID=UPI003CE88664